MDSSKFIHDLELENESLSAYYSSDGAKFYSKNTDAAAMSEAIDMNTHLRRINSFNMVQVKSYRYDEEKTNPESLGQNIDSTLNEILRGSKPPLLKDEEKLTKSHIQGLNSAIHKFLPMWMKSENMDSFKDKNKTIPFLKQLHTSIMFPYNYHRSKNHNQNKDKIGDTDIDLVKSSKTWDLNSQHEQKYDNDFDKECRNSLHNIRKEYPILCAIFECLRENKFEDYRRGCILYLSIVLFSVDNVVSFFSGVSPDKALKTSQAQKSLKYVIMHMNNMVEIADCEKGYEKIIENYFEDDKIDLIKKINTGEDKKLNSELYNNRIVQFFNQKNNKYDR